LITRAAPLYAVSSTLPPQPVFFPHCQTENFTRPQNIMQSNKQFRILECSYHWEQNGRRESKNRVSVGMFWVRSVCSYSSRMQLCLDPRPVLQYNVLLFLCQLPPHPRSTIFYFKISSSVFYKWAAQNMFYVPYLITTAIFLQLFSPNSSQFPHPSDHHAIAFLSLLLQLPTHHFYHN
jgi:hypothetical protein